MTFWPTLDIPAGMFVYEDPLLARAQKFLIGETAFADTGSEAASWWICDSMHTIGGGWEARACAETLPNTHWHLMRLDQPDSELDGIWAALRVHKVFYRNDDRYGRWQDWTPEQRRTHLAWSASTSPMGRTLGDLFEEITRHGEGFEGHPNTYPHGEVHALSLALNLDDADMETARFLLALGNTCQYPRADALAHRRAGLYPPRRGNRLPAQTQRSLPLAALT